jgi:hypothetical protein
MFERLADAAVVDVLTSAARAENVACARRFAAMGELYARRAPEDDTERAQWAIDGFENVVAEIGVALGITRGRAAAQLETAISLRDELPKVAKVFATGVIDYRMVSTFVWRTGLIEDAGLRAEVDAALAKYAPKWTKLSHNKLVERVDFWVAWFDPLGVRVPTKSVDNRNVHIEPTYPGMASVWASMPLADASLLDDRLDAIAATVCPDDPRTHRQRRADALAALAGFRDRLACGCGSADCPAAAAAKPLAEVVIHVLAEQATVAGSGRWPGYVTGWGPVPAKTVRELAASATVKPLIIPSALPELGYRPSAALAAFVRARDLTCRFPGCDRPAVCCDIDHTVPYPIGPTHPSNLKLYCRAHHLLKTFYPGWTDHQLPDGTVIWTAPTGHTYTTTPEGAAFFPALGTSTGPLLIPGHTGAPGDARGLMMPRRKRTRAKDRQYRIAAERRINEARAAADPPPF